jgi:hypothetical protein
MLKRHRWSHSGWRPRINPPTAPGVSLSLTKALVEANRAQFHIRTGAHSGTLIEVVFSQAMARV